MQILFTLLVVIGIFKLLKLWMQYTRIGAETLYVNTYNGRLYRYNERWNVHGHRCARQDWWQEVVLTGRGSVKTVGRWEKRNVGYALTETDAWCYPYQVLSTAELLERDQQHADSHTPAIS
jgi:hypothetical protein